MLTQKLTVILFTSSLLLVLLGWTPSGKAEDLDLPDSVLGSISAQGISVGGDLTNSCSTSANSVCQGTFDWNDNHQFDASDHKGSIDQSGNVQQNVSAEINSNATQSATALGVNTVGNLNSDGGVITMLNTNNATSFIGGF
jgi:hypothetical protein